MDAEWRAFLHSQPYLQFVDVDPDTGDRMLKIKLSRPVPPALSDLGVEAIEGMRAALDQAHLQHASLLVICT